MADLDLGTDCASTFGAAGIGVDKYFRRVSGPTAVAHAIARRLTSPRGSIPWALDEGMDMRGWLNDGMSRSELLAMSSAVRDEMLRDDRVSDGDVTCSFDDATSALIVTVNGQTAAGPFALVFLVSASAAKVLSLT